MRKEEKTEAVAELEATLGIVDTPKAEPTGTELVAEAFYESLSDTRPSNTTIMEWVNEINQKQDKIKFCYAANTTMGVGAGAEDGVQMMLNKGYVKVSRQVLDDFGAPKWDNPSIHVLALRRELADAERKELNEQARRSLKHFGQGGVEGKYEPGAGETFVGGAQN